jgi:hypothetical protein
VFLIYCSFIYRLGGSCAHITAMFFRIEAAIRSGVTNPACTSQPCTWTVPAQKTQIEPQSVRDMIFKAAKFNKSKYCAGVVIPSSQFALYLCHGSFSI